LRQVNSKGFDSHPVGDAARACRIKGKVAAVTRPILRIPKDEERTGGEKLRGSTGIKQPVAFPPLAMIRVNLNSLVALTLGILPTMVENRGGMILNVSSTAGAGLQASPYFTVYAATKAFVLLFSEGLRKELKDRNTNVKITCLCPEPTRTEFASVAEADGMSAPDYMWMESEEVVKIGLQSLEDNDSVCIPGISNKIHANTVKWMPRSILTDMLGRMNKP